MESEQPSDNSNNKLIFWVIGLVSLGCLILACPIILFGLLLIFASSSGVAPFIYTLF